MRAAAALVVAVVAVACTSGAPGPVRFSESWPAQAGAYDEVTRNWTRHGRLMSGYDKTLEVWATLKTPEWRAAYVQRRADREGLGASERAALMTQQKQADQAHHEVHLRVTTFDRRENNLHNPERTVWRVALVDEKGNRIAATTIKRDRRPRGLLRTYFLEMDDFAESYVAEFPRTPGLLGEATRKLSLRISSGHGVVDLTWRAAAQ